MGNRNKTTKNTPVLQTKKDKNFTPDMEHGISSVLNCLKVSRENDGKLDEEFKSRFRPTDYDPQKAHMQYLIFCAVALDELVAIIEGIVKNYAGSSKEQIFPYLEELSENNIPIPPGIMLRITGLLMGKKNKRGRPRQTTSEEEEEKQKLAGIIMGLADAKGKIRLKRDDGIDFTNRQLTFRTINRLIWGKACLEKDFRKEIRPLFNSEIGKMWRDFSSLALKKTFTKQELDNYPWPINRKQTEDLQNKIYSIIAPFKRDFGGGKPSPSLAWMMKQVPAKCYSKGCLKNGE